MTGNEIQTDKHFPPELAVVWPFSKPYIICSSDNSSYVSPPTYDFAIESVCVSDPVTLTIDYPPNLINKGTTFVTVRRNLPNEKNHLHQVKFNLLSFCKKYSKGRRRGRRIMSSNISHNVSRDWLLIFSVRWIFSFDLCDQTKEMKHKQKKFQKYVIQQEKLQWDKQAIVFIFNDFAKTKVKSLK